MINHQQRTPSLLIHACHDAQPVPSERAHDLAATGYVCVSPGVETGWHITMIAGWSQIGHGDTPNRQGSASSIRAQLCCRERRIDVLERVSRSSTGTSYGAILSTETSQDWPCGHGLVTKPSML